MKLFKTLVLKDSVEIKTTPEKIWKYFIGLEQNYKAWHPEDHILFRWTEGAPMESGSSWYAEEVVRGKVFTLKGTVGEVIPQRKIVFNYSFPLSIVTPKFEWLIGSKGSKSIFTATSYMRAEGLMRMLAKYVERKDFDALIEITKKHMREEGENLKKILESEEK